MTSRRAIRRQRRRLRWEIYQDKARRWRWRVRDAAGDVVGSSAVSFAWRVDAKRNAALFGYSDR